jgi:hypothetical protein
MYYEKIYNQNLAAHEQMSKTFINTIAKALQEYDTESYVPDNTEPLRIYKYLTWSGLSKTKDFEKLDVGEQERILNTASVEKYNKSQTNFGKVITPTGKPCK